ncbi:TPA: hypothetical protein TVL29_002073 [Streptococcus equi subsp. zooepidemicus]|nr:hypothetical protein [Streptococcus equi subsp. zooepidemicus]HEL1185270.1 hypothetical protein [Streptococcus equi subsp. zooepidemicus]
MIDSIKVEEIAPTLSSMSRLMKYAQAIHKNEARNEMYVFADLIKAGWDKEDIVLEGEFGGDSSLIIADIVLEHKNKPIAIVEVKSDISRVTADWLERVKNTIECVDVPIIILAVGNYYEIHLKKNGKMTKSTTPPSKEYLLSLIEGKEEY